ADRQALPQRQRLEGRLDLRRQRPRAVALVGIRRQCAQRLGHRRRRRGRRAHQALRHGHRPVRSGQPGAGVHRLAQQRGLPAPGGGAAAHVGGARDPPAARQRRSARGRTRPADRACRVPQHGRRGGAARGRGRRRTRAPGLRAALSRRSPDPMEQRPVEANADIARFLRRLQWGLVALAALWLVALLGPILTPFVFAALLGWLGDPMVDRLERAGRSRPVAVTLVFVLMVMLLVLVVLILVPMMERQVVTLVEALPEYRAWFMDTALPWVEARTGMEITGWLDPQRLFELARAHWAQAGGVATTLFGYLSSSGFAFLAWIANLVLLPILTFYFLRDWDLLVGRVAVMIPRDHIDTVARLAKESDEVLGAFLRGQFIVMLALGAIYAIGLSIVGLKLGLLIGIVAGLISFVPYLGAASGIVLAVLAALVQAQG